MTALAAKAFAYDYAVSDCGSLRTPVGRAQAMLR